MSDNGYLAEYRRLGEIDLSGGLGGMVRRLLDGKAKALGQADRHALFLPRALALMGLSLQAPRVVLEIGCGSGWAISFKHPNVKRIAMDRGSLYRQELEKQGIDFHEVDVCAEPMPVEDASVDMIIINHVIEHIADTAFLMNEMRRVLRVGGGIYVRTPDITRVKFAFWNDYTHVRPFTPAAMDHLMRSFGFEKRFLFASDHPRIVVDELTNGRFRRLLFSRLLGGREIEAGYVLRSHG